MMHFNIPKADNVKLSVLFALNDNFVFPGRICGDEDNCCEIERVFVPICVKNPWFASPHKTVCRKYGERKLDSGNV